MVYEIYCADDELQNHGIRGMKWGIRRYQNKDGSLTAAGKKRYEAEMAKVKAETRKARNEQRVQKKFSKIDEAKQKLEELKKANRAPEEAAKKAKEDAKKAKSDAKDKEKQEHKEETDAEKKARILKNPSPEEVYKNRHLFSGAELGELQVRFSYEKNIQGMIPKEPDRKQERVDNFVKNMNNVVTTGVALGKVYNLGATIYNAFSPASAKSMAKLDLDSLTKGNKETRKKEEEAAAKKAEEEAAKNKIKREENVAKLKDKLSDIKSTISKKNAENAEAKAAKNAANAEAKAAKEAERAAKIKRAAAAAAAEEEARVNDSASTSNSKSYSSHFKTGGDLSNSSNIDRGKTTVAGLLGTSKIAGYLPAPSSSSSSSGSNPLALPPSTVDRGRNAVAGLLGTGSSNNSNSSSSSYGSKSFWDIDTSRIIDDDFDDYVEVD